MGRAGSPTIVPGSQIGGATEQPMNHLVITGPGRAGTTFLVRLLGRLGLDTGFPTDAGEARHLSRHSHAGLEVDWPKLGRAKLPYVVKGPGLALILNRRLDECPDLRIDHCLICVREPDLVAASRKRVDSVAPPVPRGMFKWGGLYPNQERQDQAAVARQHLAAVAVACARHDVPHTLLYFPRLVLDVDYLAGKLRPVTADGENLRRVFAELSRPGLVHFRSERRPAVPCGPK